jgi:hypothetical protein
MVLFNILSSDIIDLSMKTFLVAESSLFEFLECRSRKKCQTNIFFFAATAGCFASHNPERWTTL